jgi:hypothetical protein
MLVMALGGTYSQYDDKTEDVSSKRFENFGHG